MNAMAEPHLSSTASHDEVVARLIDRLPEEIRVFAGPQDGAWVAHAVDFDIVGEGDTRDEALQTLFRLIDAYLHSVVELDEVESHVPRPAPRHVIAQLYGRVILSRVKGVLRSSARMPSVSRFDRASVEDRLRLSH